jgi:PAS domain S-box-containing protein
MEVSFPFKKPYLSPILIFILFSLGISAAGYYFFEYQKKIIKEEKRDQLSAIADLKVSQIETWRKNCLQDAAIIHESPFVADHIQQFLKYPQATKEKKEILEWMASIRKYSRYQSLHLLDKRGKVRLSAPAGQEVLGPDARRLAAEAMREKKVIFSDLYQGKITKVVCLSLLVPIHAPQKDIPVGVFFLRIDPYQFLYPLIQSWPTPSRTAESLLIRREGEGVVFLNELRHRKNTPLTFDFSQNHQQSLAGMAAVGGQETVMEGLDYRAIPVLMVIRRIPDSPWLLIAKVDQEEIYASLRRRGWYIGIIVNLLIIGGGLSLGLVWRRQHDQFQKEQYESGLERLALVQHFHYLTKYANDIILLMDEDFRIIEANERAEESYGFTNEELLQLNLRNLQSPEEQAIFDRQKSRLDGRFGIVYETWHKRKDGTRFPVENGFHTIEVEGKKFYQSIIHDLSERKKLESQLLQAQKMEAIGTLAGGIAHDFNNILAIIMGYAQLISWDIPEGSKVSKGLNEVLKASRRARDLVQQILTFSRRSSQERKPVEIGPIVKETLKLLKATLPSTIEIRQRLESNSDVIETDPSQIHQVLMNLCTNAAYAMRENGGILEVSLGEVDLEESISATYPDLQAGPYVRMSVSDTGHGIPPELLKRIFDPYFTTKPVGEGTGLGLAVVHGIIKSHGGEITVHSEPGKGTTFHVYLPRMDGAQEIAGSQEPTPLPLGNQERVLLIDDEKALADVGKQMLEQLGYKVTVRTSSIEALELFRTQPERFDLVITDMTMPNMTGDKLAREMVRLRPGIPIILCTGFSEHVTEEKIKKIGIREFVMKPMVMSDLAKTVRRVLQQKEGREN